MPRLVLLLVVAWLVIWLGVCWRLAIGLLLLFVVARLVVGLRVRCRLVVGLLLFLVVARLVIWLRVRWWLAIGLVLGIARLLICCGFIERLVRLLAVAWLRVRWGLAIGWVLLLGVWGVVMCWALVIRLVIQLWALLHWRVVLGLLMRPVTVLIRLVGVLFIVARLQVVSIPSAFFSIGRVPALKVITGLAGIGVLLVEVPILALLVLILI
jgi:hypothetical protein